MSKQSLYELSKKINQDEKTRFDVDGLTTHNGQRIHFTKAHHNKEVMEKVKDTIKYSVPTIIMLMMAFHVFEIEFTFKAVVMFTIAIAVFDVLWALCSYTFYFYAKQLMLELEHFWFGAIATLVLDTLILFVRALCLVVFLDVQSKAFITLLFSAVILHALLTLLTFAISYFRRKKRIVDFLNQNSQVC